jgi:hypothetical protein
LLLVRHRPAGARAQPWRGGADGRNADRDTLPLADAPAAIARHCHPARLAHAPAHRYCVHHTHAVADNDGDADSNADGHAHRDANGHGNLDADADRDAITDADRDTIAHTDGDADGDTVAHAHRYARRVDHAYPNCRSFGQPHGDR